MSRSELARAWLTPRRLATVAALTAMWCVLWGSASAANVLAGAVLAIMVLATGVGTPARGSVRIVPLAKLLWLVLVDLAKSTVSVAWEVLTPTDYTQEAIIAVDPGFECRKHFLLLVVAITLTPGTAVVDADPDSGTLYLHVLHHERSDEVIEHTYELARLASEALPVDAEGGRSLASEARS